MRVRTLSACESQEDRDLRHQCFSNRLYEACDGEGCRSQPQFLVALSPTRSRDDRPTVRFDVKELLAECMAEGDELVFYQVSNAQLLSAGWTASLKPEFQRDHAEKLR